VWLSDTIQGHGLPLWSFAITLTGHTTLGRTPLDEWSARRTDLYLTKHNTHKRQTLMPRRDSNPQAHKAKRLIWKSKLYVTKHFLWPMAIPYAYISVFRRREGHNKANTPCTQKNIRCMHQFNGHSQTHSPNPYAANFTASWWERTQWQDCFLYVVKATQISRKSGTTGKSSFK
jgi:hypothetical protein